jgi:peptidyl-prolyl cis-trans isomerase SurA
MPTQPIQPGHSSTVARRSIRGKRATCLAIAAFTVMCAARSASAQFSVSEPRPFTPPPQVQQAPQPPPVKAAKPAKAAIKPAAATSTSASIGKADQSIILLVNDEPITAYEVDQRARFMALSSNIGPKAQENFKRIVTSEATNTQLKGILEKTIQENEGKTREQIIAIFEERKKQFALGLQKQAVEGARSSMIPGMRKQAQEELLEEKLKLQEARKVGAEVGDADANRILTDMAGRNKLTLEQFSQNLRGQGVDISTLRSRFIANLAWRNVVQRKFQAQIAVNQKDVDRMIANSADSNEDAVELQIQKITLPLPPKLDQGAMAKGLADADGMRRKFGGCKSTAQLSAGAGGKFEDIKYIRPSTIAEPTRSFLLSAKDGEMLPPQTTSGGIEIYAVCGRRVIKADETKRAKAQDELQSQEFERLAKRHLRDLRQDAHIEIR